MKDFEKENNPKNLVVLMCFFFLCYYRWHSSVKIISLIGNVSFRD